MNINSLKEDKSIETVLERLEKLENKIYPVGSIYISMNNTDPSILFGGKWEKIKDRFLLGISGNDPWTAGLTTSGDVGGSINHTHSFYVSQYKTKMMLADVRALNASTFRSDEIKTVETSLAWNCNSQLGSGQAWNYNDGENLRSKGTTTGNSNLPPYLTVYMWKRIS